MGEEWMGWFLFIEQGEGGREEGKGVTLIRPIQSEPRNFALEGYECCLYMQINTYEDLFASQLGGCGSHERD